MYHYRKESDGRWLLCEDGKSEGYDVLHAFYHLGVCYEVMDGLVCLLKIGEKDSVLRWREDTMRKMRKAGLYGDADGLKFIDASRASVDGVNKVMDTSALREGYFLECLGRVIDVKEEP